MRSKYSNRGSYADDYYKEREKSTTIFATTSLPIIILAISLILIIPSALADSNRPGDGDGSTITVLGGRAANTVDIANTERSVSNVDQSIIGAVDHSEQSTIPSTASAGDSDQSITPMYSPDDLLTPISNRSDDSTSIDRRSLLDDELISIDSPTESFNDHQPSDGETIEISSSGNGPPSPELDDNRPPIQAVDASAINSLHRLNELDDEEDDDHGSILTSKEIKAIDLELFKRQLLRKMGLNERPPTIAASSSNTKSDQLRLLPQYLWDIYDNVVDGVGLASTSDFDHVRMEILDDEDEIDHERPGYSYKSIRSYFDTVRTFFPDLSDNPSSRTTLLFDIHRLPSNERWVEAELRVPWHDLLFSNFLSTDESLNPDENGLSNSNSTTTDESDGSNSDLAPNGFTIDQIRTDNNRNESIDTSEFNNNDDENRTTKSTTTNRFVRINLYEVINDTMEIRNLIDTKLINLASKSPYKKSWTSFDVLSIVSRASMNSNVIKLSIEFVEKTPTGIATSQFVTSNRLSNNKDDEELTEHSAALIMYGFDRDGSDKPIKYKNFFKHYMDDDDQLDEGNSTDDELGTIRQKRQTTKKKQSSRIGGGGNGRARTDANTRSSSSSIDQRRSQSINNHRSSNTRISSSSSTSRRQNQQNLCQRRPLIIRFEDLNWQDWILAPQEYTAYYCAGQCSYPFADNQNTTNHAIVQALINSVNPRTAPKPNCVPTETSSISMLYTDIDRNIVIKNYPDMIVEGCGCR